MKTIFVGAFAARVAPRILAKVTENLDTIAGENSTVESLRIGSIFACD